MDSRSQSRFGRSSSYEGRSKTTVGFSTYSIFRSQGVITSFVDRSCGFSPCTVESCRAHAHNAVPLPVLHLLMPVPIDQRALIRNCIQFEQCQMEAELSLVSTAWNHKGVFGMPIRRCGCLPFVPVELFPWKVKPRLKVFPFSSVAPSFVFLCCCHLVCVKPHDGFHRQPRSYRF